MLDIATKKRDKCRFNRIRFGTELDIILEGAEKERKGLDVHRIINILEEMKECGCSDCIGTLRKLVEVSN